jgi:hypothetical protein
MARVSDGSPTPPLDSRQVSERFRRTYAATDDDDNPAVGWD